MVDIVFDVVVLQIVHHMRSVALEHTKKKDKINFYLFIKGFFFCYFDLFVWRDGTENDLRETLRWKHVKANSTDNTHVLHQNQTFVFSSNKSKLLICQEDQEKKKRNRSRIENQAGYVFAWHARQLMGKHVLCHDEPQ